jgi:hypothetical protein
MTEQQALIAIAVYATTENRTAHSEHTGSFFQMNGEITCMIKGDFLQRYNVNPHLRNHICCTLR